MIIVANTKELEEKYNLSELRDDEQVVIQGGLKNKAKYDAERYQRRVTYIGWQVKQIISQMKLIESTIPKEWNEYQRAKYIYEVLGNNIEYNYNKEDYKTQQSSNLTCLLSRKGICAGYSLLYKEMMDRQGIECDYIRGKANDGHGKIERHAWNVLTINGQSFPVDLTWDSAMLRRGENELEYFGVDGNFEKSHVADLDEKSYQYVTYLKDSINAIETDTNNEKNQIDEKQQMEIIQLAINENYAKFKQLYGIDGAKEQIKMAIQQYIDKGKANVFTRQGNARQQIEQYVKPEDMLKLMSKSYVEQNLNNKNQTILEHSVNETAMAYGMEHTTRALVQYITTGKLNSFTRTNNARKNLGEFVTTEDAMKSMIDTVVEQNIQFIEKSNSKYDEIINKNQAMYFSGDEFAQVQLPKKQRKGILTKAIQWIKEKMKEKHNNRENENDKNQEIENNYSKDDAYQK